MAQSCGDWVAGSLPRLAPGAGVSFALRGEDDLRDADELRDAGELPCAGFTLPYLASFAVSAGRGLGGGVACSIASASAPARSASS